MRYPFPISNAFALLWPLSLAIPNFFGNPTRFGFLAFCGVATAESLLGQMATLLGKQQAARTSYYVTTAIVLLFLGMVIRSILQTPLSIFESSARIGLATFVGLSATFLWSYLCLPRDEDRVDRRFGLLCVSVPLYLATALILSVLFGDPAGTKGARVYSETLALFGIYTPRLKDLAGLIGSNTIGAVAAMGVVVTWSMLTRYRRRPAAAVLWSAMLAASSYILLRSDGRALLIGAVLALLITSFMNRRALRFTGAAMALFLAISPWLFYYAFDILNTSTAATSVLTRQTGNGAALGVGTGRQDIWQQAFILLDNGFVENLFGNGNFGHYSAGISLAAFEFIFEDTDVLETLHNTTLQAVFDIGYVGTFLFIVILLATVRALTGYRVEPEERRLAFGLLALFMLIGLSEVIIGAYNLFPFFIFLAVVFYGLSSRKRTTSASRTLFAENGDQGLVSTPAVLVKP